MSYDVLDLFSAAAGGWSLGMHRAGFRTVAACEFVDWRRALYAENNPDVLLYDDVRTLTAARLRADLGYVPDVVVGSPPCQDISSANAKGKGVEGERSGLFFEAVRIIGECRPRWFALENSANLRTRGADRVLGALEDLGYACWATVVRARDVGANHERPRAWVIGCDVDQVVAHAADADGHGWPAWRSRRRGGLDLSLPHDPQHASGLGYEGWRARGYGPDGLGSASTARSDDGDAAEDGCGSRRARRRPLSAAGLPEPACGHVAHADRDGQLDRAEHGEVGRGESAGGPAAEPWVGWNGGLAGHLRVDDGLSAWVAGARVALSDGKGAAAASLIVEAFGDAVVPQIPEVIGRAILNTEAALAAIHGRAVA